MKKKVARVFHKTIKRRKATRIKTVRRNVCIRLKENPGIKQVKPLNRAHLLADFLHLQQKLGRRPSINEFAQHCHTPKVLVSVFGEPGWQRLIKAAGKKAMPKSIQNSLTAEHLIEDYLETEKLLGRKPGFSHFHALHRHGLKTLVRVFGRPGWTNLGKAAAAAKMQIVKQRPGTKTGSEKTVRACPRRPKEEILAEIREAYRTLVAASKVLRRKALSRKALEQSGKSRAQLNALFHEFGRTIFIEEAFQGSDGPRGPLQPSPSPSPSPAEWRGDI